MQKKEELRTAQELVPPTPPENPEITSLKAQVVNALKQINEALGKTGAGGSAGGTGGFVSPLSAAPVTSPSLRSLFPDVEAAHIASIISHEFPGDNLFKLDWRYWDKEPTFALNPLTGQFKKSATSAKRYKDYDALYLPLVTYFSILSVHMQNQRTVPFNFSFLIHVQKLARNYERHAVLEYTMKFFNRRGLEMPEQENYSGWGIPDAHFMAEHVNGYRKASNKVLSTKGTVSHSSPLVCKNWNANKCTTNGAKCLSGRSHVCSMCGKADHTALTHSNA
jgi:hypothetical protein